uniref:[histone H3]-lysine(4) N-trimethyltransferase n=1 Tax=Astyanax mexicanus TaxID=7994 RepID=A0A8B9H2U7_ASTMX
MTLQKKDAVEVFAAGEKGRGLRTTKEMQPGEVVFAEASFAAVVFDSLSMQVCHNCFRRQAYPHRCAQCKFAYYCDRTCQHAAWEEHKQECAAIRQQGKAPNESVRLAARTLWRMQRHTSKVSDGQLTTLDFLEDHISKMSPEDLKVLNGNVQKFKEYWPSKSKQFGVDHLQHIFGVINCNAYTLSDQKGLQAVGVGLFPNLCLVNHDCRPNCTVILNHGNQTFLDASFHSQRRIELRALGNISEGEELTVSYVDFLNVSKDRQQQLKWQYYFDCNCEYCAGGVKDDLMTAVKEKDGKKPSAEQVKEVTEFTTQALAKIEQARTEGNFQEVSYCIRDIIPLRACFIKTLIVFLSSVRKLYQPNSAQLGMATMRAGVIHWHAGNIEIGHGMICQAFAILMITHGPHHPITKDLESMRTQTEMELRMFKQNKAMYHSMREAALNSKPTGAGKVH